MNEQFIWEEVEATNTNMKKLNFTNNLVLVAQSRSILCDPMDLSPPGFSVHRILQAYMCKGKQHLYTIFYFQNSYGSNNARETIVTMS